MRNAVRYLAFIQVLFWLCCIGTIAIGQYLLSFWVQTDEKLGESAPISSVLAGSLLFALTGFIYWKSLKMAWNLLNIDMEMPQIDIKQAGEYLAKLKETPPSIQWAMEAFRTELSKQKTLVDKKRKRTNITTTSTKIFKYQYWQDTTEILDLERLVTNRTMNLHIVMNTKAGDEMTANEIKAHRETEFNLFKKKADGQESCATQQKLIKLEGGDLYGAAHQDGEKGVDVYELMISKKEGASERDDEDIPWAYVLMSCFLGLIAISGIVRWPLESCFTKEYKHEVNKFIYMTKENIISNVPCHEGPDFSVDMGIKDDQAISQGEDQEGDN